MEKVIWISLLISGSSDSSLALVCSATSWNVTRVRKPSSAVSWLDDGKLLKLAK
jgi:hypothetical protein